MKVIVCGASGRMGKEILNLIEMSENKITCVGQISKAQAPKEITADVVIDFSLPQALPQLLEYCQNNSLPLVSGTTGLGEQDFKKLEELSKKVAVLWAPNMSLGVHFVDHLIAQFSKVKDNFDFQIEEFHHNKKLDKPSGTGKLLQQTLHEAIGEPPPEVLSVRGGGIFGIHKVWAMSDEEVIQIEHTALNRQVFAKGALVAAKWLKDKPPGMYSMKDVLGLKV